MPSLKDDFLIALEYLISFNLDDFYGYLKIVGEKLAIFKHISGILANVTARANALKNGFGSIPFNVSNLQTIQSCINLVDDFKNIHANEKEITNDDLSIINLASLSSSLFAKLENIQILDSKGTFYFFSTRLLRHLCRIQNHLI